MKDLLENTKPKPQLITDSPKPVKNKVKAIDLSNLI